MIVTIPQEKRAAALAALYNASAPLGMGWLQARNGTMTEEQAQALIDGTVDSGDYERIPGQRHEPYFDYLYGRPLKLNLSKPEVNLGGFDRDNGGEGAGARVLREAGVIE